MSYRCQSCGAHVDGPMRRHIRYREDRTVASEVPVCDACAAKLRKGEQLASLTRSNAPERTKRRVANVPPAYQEPQFGE